MSRFITAEDYCISVKDGTHNSPKRSEYGVRLVTSKNIIGGNLELSSAYFISEEDASEINRRSKVDKNDVLISMIGTVGEVCLIKENPNFVIKNVGLLKNQCPYKAKWLYFYLKTNKAKNEIKERLRGTTQQYLSLGELRNFPILLPNNDIHLKNTVNILWDLEQKIQLNTQINQTLEQIAQAIFKSWFIDFDPVHAKAEALANGQSPAQAERAAMAAISGKTPEELDRLHTTAPEQYRQLHTLAQAFPCEFDEQGVPKGWEWKPLKHFGAIICGKTPSKSKPEYYGNEIPFIKIPDMHNKIFITKSTDALSVLGGNSQRNKYIPKGSVCVSCIATVGLVSIATQRAQTNQQINSIIPNDMIFSEYLYLALSQPYMKKKMLDLASGGSATLNMNTTTFSNIEAINPSKDILDGFYNRVNSIFLKICENQNESEILSNVRDLLLPKLLSGEI